jgi:hypothetical protein
MDYPLRMNYNLEVGCGAEEEGRNAEDTNISIKKYLDERE